MTEIFIDGKAGTTGLRIDERLAKREDIHIISLPDELRKDPNARRQAIKDADAAFLCLPDDAAREAVAFAEDCGTVILDTSTAHRTADGWVYGFPELSEENKNAIRASKRIAVPGCHASGFISLAAPLVAAGILPTDSQLCAHSLTGYSGGGKKMIAQYEADGRDGRLDAPREYALAQTHKHLPEMKTVCGLETEPCFCPIVSDYYSGMTVVIQLFKSQLNEGYGVENIKNTYKKRYNGPIVKYTEKADEQGFISGMDLSGKDTMEISVYGNDERILLVSRFDNLGKGSSGAALQCLNLVMGKEMTYGLDL